MNVFVSHAIAVGLAIIVIIALVLSLNSVGGQWSDFLREYEPKHLCASIQNSAEVLYSNTSTSGRIYLSLPKTLAGYQYSIKFINNTILIDSKNQYSCNVDNSLILSGESHSNNVYIEYSAPNSIKIYDV